MARTLGTDTVQPASDTVQASSDTVQPAADTVQPASDTIQPASDTVQASSDTVQPAPAEPVQDPYNHNFASYTTGQREQDQALKINQEHEARIMQGEAGLGALRRVDIPLLRVSKARQGSNLPMRGGSFYPDGDFDVEATDLFAQRRLRDGSLVLVAGSKSAAEVQPSPRP